MSLLVVVAQQGQIGLLQRRFGGLRRDSGGRLLGDEPQTHTGTDLSTLTVTRRTGQIAAEAPDALDRLEAATAQLELKALLDGPLDGNDAILTINARDGGIVPAAVTIMGSILGEAFAASSAAA